MDQRYCQGAMGTAKGFTGQYSDATGLDYYNARYYDPVVGLFVSADTVQGNVQGMSPYAYVTGNPETLNDPTGRCIICIAALVIAIPVVVGAIAGVIGAAVQEVTEGRDPSWQDYRDGAEIGAITGFVAFAASLLTLVDPTPVGVFTAQVSIQSFISGVAGGYIAGLVHRANGEVPNSTPTPTPTPTPTSTSTSPPPPRPLPGPTPTPTTSSGRSGPVYTPPVKSPSPPPSHVGTAYYTVVSGDTLWGIAISFYGLGFQWQRIYQANTGVIGGNPNLIYPGERLALPR